jgi:hypothetical protein
MALNQSQSIGMPETYKIFRSLTIIFVNTLGLDYAMSFRSVFGCHFKHSSELCFMYHAGNHESFIPKYTG